MARTIEDIERELGEARAAEAKRAQALRDKVKPERVYTIERVKHNDYDRIFDDTIIAYKLTGTIANYEVAKAAGHPDYALTNGAMRYYYNTVTHKIIGAVSGGTIYTTSPTTMAKVSAFIADNPNGGDITAIMRQDRADKQDRAVKGWY